MEQALAGFRQGVTRLSMFTPRTRRLTVKIAVLASTLASSASATLADGIASDWVEGFNNKARLLAGRAKSPGDKGEQLFAGIEIAMPSHWKTYWRAPGDAGGIPPEFDFSASENVADVKVLYPAPSRLVDKTGTTIGYLDQVVFPVALTPKDTSKPVQLKLKAAYGVCKEICVPAEAELELTIAPDVGPANDIALALARVPRTPAVPETDPIVENWRIESRDGKPILIFETADPAIPDESVKAVDAVADSASSVYLPLPKKIADKQHRATFEVNLTDGASIKELNGLAVRIVVIGGKGQSETAIKLP